MTLSQALFIKYLRIRCEGTWRWVDSAYNDRYYIKVPFSDNPRAICHQSSGMDRCNEAMNFLGETVEDGWN